MVVMKMYLMRYSHSKLKLLAIRYAEIETDVVGETSLQDRLIAYFILGIGIGITVR